MGVSIKLVGKFKNNKYRLAEAIMVINRFDADDELGFRMSVNENILVYLDKFKSLTLSYKIIFESSLSKPIEHTENLRLDAVSVNKAIDRATYCI